MKTKSLGGVISGVWIGVFVCMATGAAAISLAAWMISKEYIPINNIEYVCAAILIVSTLAGTAAAVKKAGQKPLPVATLTAAAYLLALLAINAMFMDGMYEGVVVTALCVAGTAACVAMLSTKRKKAMKYRTRK